MNGYVFDNTDFVTSDFLYSKFMEHFDFNAPGTRWMTMAAILNEMGVDAEFGNCVVLGKLLRKIPDMQFRRMKGQRVALLPVKFEL